MESDCILQAVVSCSIPFTSMLVSILYCGMYSFFLEWWPAMFFGAKCICLGVFTRYHSPGCILADSPSNVFFWSRHCAVFFEGGKLHERVFLMRNLGERVFSHVRIF